MLETCSRVRSSYIVGVLLSQCRCDVEPMSGQCWGNVMALARTNLHHQNLVVERLREFEAQISHDMRPCRIGG